MIGLRFFPLTSADVRGAGTRDEPLRTSAWEATCLGTDSDECPNIILHEQRLFTVLPKALKLFLILVSVSCSERWFIDRGYY